MLPKVCAAIAAVTLVSAAGLSMADTLPLSYSSTSSGTAGAGTNSTLAVPGSYYFGDTFGAAAGTAPASPNTAGFYDDFVFTISGARANAVTTDIDLGSILAINGLQVALFSYSPGQSVPIATSPLATGWSSSYNTGSGNVTLAVLPTTDLNPGTYALEVQGTVTGSAGGSYSGSLNLTPVPLPAAFPLLLTGLGTLGLWGKGRRRRAA